MTALGSTTFSLWPFLSTLTLSLGATATMEKMAPSGFQHLVQPQAWLCAVCDLISTTTGSLAQLHTRRPPAKPRLAALGKPLSIAG